MKMWTFRLNSQKWRRLAFIVCLLLPAYLMAVEVPPYTIVSESINKKVIVLAVNYESANADMSGKQTVSGLITIPASLKAKAVILESHYTETDDSGAPSITGSTTSSMLFQSRYCIVAPDYLGFGCSADQPHTYLCQAQNAANSIDLAIVARDIILKRGVSLEADALFNIGYSQGGGVAFAVHRALDMDPELAEWLHFAKSWCGAGPYDLGATLDAVLESDGLGIPALLPITVKGLMAGFPQCFAPDRTFADFFRPELVSAGIESWVDCKAYSTGTISSKMTAVSVGDSSPAAFMNPEIFDLNSVLRRELDAVAKAGDILDGWTLRTPLVLLHQPCDEIVPFVNALKAVEMLGLDPDEMELDDLGVSHVSYGIVYFMFILTAISDEVDLILSTAPADSPFLTVEPVPDDADEPMYDLLGRPVGPDYRGAFVRGGRVYLPSAF